MRAPAIADAEIDRLRKEIGKRLRMPFLYRVVNVPIPLLGTDALRELDQLAYIRFASVYHAYDDIETLQREVDRLIRGRTE